MQVLSKHAVSLKEVDYLQQLIEQFLEKLKSVFPSLKLTPKHHYMIHYGEQTKRHGPLRKIWCMRYESKHQVLKRTIANSRNRKNLCKSILRRYQVRALAMRLNKTKEDHCQTSFKESLPDGAHQLVAGTTLHGKLKSDGTIYHAQQAVIFNHGLAQIVCACRATDTDLLLVRHVIWQYDPTANAFLLTDTDGFSLVNISDLTYRNPLGCYMVDGKKFAVPKQLHQNMGMESVSLYISCSLYICIIICVLLLYTYFISDK